MICRKFCTLYIFYWIKISLNLRFAASFIDTYIYKYIFSLLLLPTSMKTPSTNNLNHVMSLQPTLSTIRLNVYNLRCHRGPLQEGQHPSRDVFISKCRIDINYILCNHTTSMHSNTSSEDRNAIKRLQERKYIVIKPTDKGGAIVVWRRDLYLQ